MFQKIAKHRANDASNDVHRPPLAGSESPLLRSRCIVFNPMEILLIYIHGQFFDWYLKMFMYTKCPKKATFKMLLEPK